MPTARFTLRNLCASSCGLLTTAGITTALWIAASLLTTPAMAAAGTIAIAKPFLGTVGGSAVITSLLEATFGDPIRDVAKGCGRFIKRYMAGEKPAVTLAPAAPAAEAPRLDFQINPQLTVWHLDTAALCMALRPAMLVATVPAPVLLAARL